MLLINGKIDEDQAGALGLAHYPLTGAQLFRWKRWEMGPAEEVRDTPGYCTFIARDHQAMC